ncbi:MAG: peptidylprolyl isomerase [Actinomycetota bacterium]
MRPKPFLVLALVGTVFLSACSENFKSNYFAPTAALVCGAVDCTPIAEKEVNDAFAETAAAAQEAGTFEGPRGAQNRLDAQREILADLIMREVGLQQAQVMGVQVSEAEVDERVQQIRSQFESGDAFAAQMESEGLTVDELRGFIRRDLTFVEVQEDVAKDAAPSDEEVAEFYELNRSQFEAQVRVAHIVVCENFDEQQRSCTPSPGDEELAQQIVTRAREGEDFAALAAEHSADAVSAMNGGELGYLSRGDLVGPLEEAAFNLFEPGDISEPVRTDFGLHIVKLLEVGQPLEAARERIADNLQVEQETKAFEDWLNDALKDARINVNPRLGRFDKISRSVVPADSEEQEADPSQDS